MRNLARMQQILDRMAQPGIAQAAWCKERDDFYRELLNELWRRDQEIMRLIDRMRAFLLDMLKQQERERETKEWQESWERYGERWEELKSMLPFVF